MSLRDRVRQLCKEHPDAMVRLAETVGVSTDSELIVDRDAVLGDALSGSPIQARCPGRRF